MSNLNDEQQEKSETESEDSFDQANLSINQAHALQCFKPKELFNINTNAAFVKMKPKDPDESGEESEDDELEIQDLLKDDGQFKIPKEKPGV